MNDGIGQKSRELIGSAIIVLVTAAAGGLASYIATWNIEAQKARFEASKKVQDDFQGELSKALLAVRKLSDGLTRTKKIDHSLRSEAVSCLLSMQIIFHPNSGRWPSEHKQKAKEVMDELERYQVAIDVASNAAEIDKASEILYSFFKRKDELFSSISRDTDLRIYLISVDANR
ncbi:hypothetical protein [Phaeospirillum tilakii]|uniref:Uncharacterized protein n=1 Tax=Phaeospirillum tilakii TaxID=741673 RepID=A0ABW5C9V9_9PROT